MSTTHQTTNPSSANFTAIFDVASNDYKTITKQDLEAHPFAAALENSNSLDSVMNVFRKQAQAFDKFCKGDDKLMAWLAPIVNILFTFSGTLGEGIGLVSIQSFHDTPVRHLLSSPFSPAKTIFTGIGVLLEVSLFPRSLHVHFIYSNFNSGGKGRYRELRSAREPLRAHPIFPSTSSTLHISPTHTRDDRATRKDHGPDSLYSRAFN